MKQLLILCLLLLFSGCKNMFEPNAADYTKDKAAGTAMVKLVRYAEKHHVPVYKFKGPYFDPHIGGDFPTYTVCYKHPIHFFCYDDWTGNEDSGPFKPGEMKTEQMKWLEQQPN